MSDIKELHDAINNQDLEGVKKLLVDRDIIAKINGYEVSDLTPLAVALQALAKPESNEKGELAYKILNALLQVPELDVNQRVTSMRGDTPLIFAIDMGFDEKLLKPLLDHKKIDITLKGQDGGTAMHHAQDNGFKDIEARLEKIRIEKGLPIVEREKKGKRRGLS
jgi:ankyrin repeat protein